MTKLRDVNLRWPGDKPGPDWFWKSNVAEYFFFRELRALKIETPGLSKINVYCASRMRPYDGKLFDGVADVHVAANWTGVEQMSGSALTDRCVSLLERGVIAVLDWFGLSSVSIKDAGQRARVCAASFSIPLGKKAETIGRALSGRLHVRPLADLSACLVVLVISRPRAIVGERAVCTTFPSPEIALDAFESLACTEKEAIAKFRKGGAIDKRVFGRANFDHRGMDRVDRLDEPKPKPPYFLEEPTFRVSIDDLVSSS